MHQDAVTSVRCVAAWLFLLATSATASPGHPNRSRKRGLVTDRAMEAWYHPPLHE